MTTVEIYNALVEAGVEKDKAKEVSKIIVTKDILDDSVDRLSEKIELRFTDLQRQINLLIGVILAINGAILIAVLFD